MKRRQRIHRVIVEITMSENMGTSERAAIQEVRNLIELGARLQNPKECKYVKLVLKSYKRHKQAEEQNRCRQGRSSAVRAVAPVGPKSQEEAPQRSLVGKRAAPAKVLRS